ncbi:hypothetical protein RND81_01G060300 [Saponaria officinalis]|uniref:Fatty acyl-CoA reductase n=1 Tax=Saponaria officinalis TaxID=3572 RepID=A0AAW1NBX5_SAPOF
MELGSVLKFLENKAILVTGGAGFLAKIFMEKVLRTQPNVKKVYLLLRANDDKAASLRLQNEILGKELFKVLKQKMGAKFNSFISEKVTVVAGDITLEDLSIKDLNLKNELWSHIDVIVNLAANTNFDERYDVSLYLNTFGAKHVLDFAKKCTKLKVFIQVSTAYVSGETAGVVKETPYKMGEALNGRHGLDIEMEKRLVEYKLEDLFAEGATQDVIKLAMKDMAIQRTIDSLAVAYGKGRLPCFLGNPHSIVDVIPADMVVNSIIVAAMAHANEKGSVRIYHVGSSVKNPVNFNSLHEITYQFFKNHPCINKSGNPIIVGHVKVLGSMSSFKTYLSLHYLLPLKGLEVLNAAMCQYFKGTCMDMRRKINLLMRLIDIYRPYLFYKAIYDDTNTERLRIATRETEEVETEMFYFDPNLINWEDYFMNTHLPGIVKYVLK